MNAIGGAPEISNASGAAPRQPYPGLRPFRREETDLFFGREDCVDQLIDLLAREHFLAVLGSSGSGKSSLVKTGLLDGLELGLMAQAGSRWRIVEFRPGDDPVRNLARALAESDGGKARDEDIGDLRTFLTRGPRAVIEWCKDGHLGPRENLLLLVDQFEELFRYQGYAGREEAEAFVALLLESSKPGNGIPIYAVLTMRSEFLGACALIEGLAERMNAAQFLTPRMTREQCRAAIEGPAAVCGIAIEPALVNQLLNELSNFAPWEADDSRGQLNQLDRLARRADQLPLLQHALNRLWEHTVAADADGRGPILLRLADFEAMGGLQGALNRHADEILARLKPDRRPIAETVFRALTAGTTASDAVRRPTLFKDLVAIAAGDDESARIESAEGVRDVLEAFRARGRNFLLPESDVAIVPDTRIDISHESVIRQWRTLAGWLEIEARDAQQWRRLIDAAELERKREGGRLQGLTLQYLLDWRNKANPTRAWADRYGPPEAYDQVISFLTRSAEAEGELKEAERRREAELAAAAQRERTRRARAWMVRVAVVGSLVAVALALFAGYQWRNAEVQRQRAEGEAAIASRLRQDSMDQAQLAEKQRDAAELDRAKAILAQGRLLASQADDKVGGGDVVTGMLQALATLPDVAAGSGRPYVPGAEAALFAGTLTRREIAVLDGDGAAVESAAFSPDGKQIVTASDNKTATVWDAQTLTPLVVLKGHDDKVWSAVFSPDGKRIATASLDKTARIWDAATGVPIAVLKHDADVWTATFSPDGSRIVTAVADKMGHVWDGRTYRQIGTLKGHDDLVVAATYSRDGRRIVTSSFDKTARVWDATSFNQVGVLKNHDGKVYYATFSPDGRRIATAAADNTARLWDARNYKEIAVLKGHYGTVYTAAFSPNGERIVTASGDDTLRIWDANTFKQIEALHGHDDTVASAEFSPDGKRILTASFDKTARLWSASNDQRNEAVLVHDDIVTSVAYSPDGKRIVTTTTDKAARVWNLVTRSLVAVLRGHEQKLYNAVFSPDGTRIATASADRTVRIWNAQTGAQIAMIAGHADEVNRVAFSSDGRRLVTASDDKTARIWDAATFTQIGVLKGHEENVLTAAFSPDGTRIVTASGDKTARVWDAMTFREIGVLKGHDETVFSAAFSPDGTRIVTASEDKTARIWDAATFAELGVLKKHSDKVWSASFSPDGKRVVTASRDYTARIWDANSFALVAVLTGHDEDVWNAVFSPDGNHVATAAADHTARIWRVYPSLQDLIDHAKDVVPRCLTREQREEATLDPDPPNWCIDMAKWPYDTPEWKAKRNAARKAEAAPLQRTVQ